MTEKKLNDPLTTIPIHMRIAQNLRLLRVCQKLSQQQVADVASMSRSCYAALENGSRQADVSTIVLLSDYYGISTDRLMKEDLSSLYYSWLQETPERHRR